MEVVRTAQYFFGNKKLTLEYLMYTHEVVIGGAPDTGSFTSYSRYREQYDAWANQVVAYRYTQRWPRFGKAVLKSNV